MTSPGFYPIPHTAAEYQALWDAATDTEHPVTDDERRRMFSAMYLSDLMYLRGFLPLDARPAL